MRVLEDVARVLASEPNALYALVFGSIARGSARPESDVDVAVGFAKAPSALEIGDLVSRLECACGRDVDIVLLDEAPLALAYRVFHDGIVVLDRDHAALVRRKARAILEYLDWKPLEDILTRGVLAAAARHGR